MARALLLGLMIAGPLTACASDDEAVERAPLPAVGEEEAAASVATSFCRLQSECDCVDDRLYPEEQCVENVTASFRQRQQASNELGLRFNGECLARKLAALDASSCDAPERFEPSQATYPGCAPTDCHIYYGAHKEGEECHVGGNQNEYDSCSPGLRCEWSNTYDPNGETGRTCVPLCKARGGVGDVCDSYDGCVVGLACDQTGGLQGVCVRLPAAGEPCAFSGGSECGDGLWCDYASGVVQPLCVARVPDGTACSNHFECTNGFCGGGVCTSAGHEGDECTISTECRSFTCELGACVAEPAEVCNERRWYQQP